MKHNKASFLAASAAAMFLNGVVQSPTAIAEEAKVHCAGINSCKGTSECKTASNACAGQNSCKGKGWVSATAEECKAKGGKVAP